MMKPEITSIEIIKGDLVEINPSIDFCKAKAYIGAFLHANVTREINGKKQTEPSIEHFLITSDKQALHTVTELPEGMMLASPTIRMKDTQWQRDDIQAWLKTNDQVNLAELYRQIRTKLERYFEFSNPATYDIVTLWAIGTYFYHLFPAYGYLFINGVKRTGKSKLLLFLKMVCHNAFMSSSITTPALQRTIESLCSTLLIDEQEFLSYKGKLSERQQELRSALLDGYHVGSYALKVEGDKEKQVKGYSQYSPKALANILGLDDILEDRCIYILMQRALGAQKNEEMEINDPEWIDIKNKLHRCYLENASVCSACSVSSVAIPAQISSRERQLWVPIFTLARIFKDAGVDNLTDIVTNYALESSDLKLSEDQETNEVILVKALSKLVKKSDWFSIKTIRDAFVGEFDNEDNTEWVKNETIANMLKRIGITQRRRLGKGTERFITVEAIEILSQRYLRIATLPTQATLPTLEG